VIILTASVGILLEETLESGPTI